MTGPARVTYQEVLLDLSIHGLANWSTDFSAITIKLAEERAALQRCATSTARCATRIQDNHLEPLWKLAGELANLIHRVEQAANHEDT